MTPYRKTEGMFSSFLDKTKNFEAVRNLEVSAMNTSVNTSMNKSMTLDLPPITNSGATSMRDSSFLSFRRAFGRRKRSEDAEVKAKGGELLDLSRGKMTHVFSYGSLRGIKQMVPYIEEEEEPPNLKLVQIA